MLVLVVFSTAMRFASVEADLKAEGNDYISLGKNTEVDYSLVDCCLINQIDKNLDNQKQEKEPLTFKKTTFSDALLQGFVTTDFFQNVLLASTIEFVFPSFSSESLNSVAYCFSSSNFFKTLFSCFISPNAP